MIQVRKRLRTCLYSSVNSILGFQMKIPAIGFLLESGSNLPAYIGRADPKGSEIINAIQKIFRLTVNHYNLVAVVDAIPNGFPKINFQLTHSRQDIKMK